MGFYISDLDWVAKQQTFLTVLEARRLRSGCQHGSSGTLSDCQLLIVSSCGRKRESSLGPFCMRAWSLSCVQLFATPRTVAHQAPLSMRFCRQEYWSGLPFPSPGDLPDPGIKSGSPALQADSSLSEPPGRNHYELEVIQVKLYLSGFH